MGPTRTTLDPDKDVVTLVFWVSPLKCGGCGGRVDTFYRFNRNDRARCSGCGEQWEVDISR